MRAIFLDTAALILATVACAGPALPSSSAVDSSHPNATVAADVPAAEASQATAAPAVGAAYPAGQHVNFKSGNLNLEGYLFKPAGDGPFPLVIWNHGSEQAPSPEGQFGSIASVFVPAGYVVFAPVRRGHGNSEGEYILDQLAAEKQAKGPAAAQQLLVQLMQGEQLDDQLAGLAYAKALPFVDHSRMVVTGCSYGGIQSLLGAENGAYVAAIAISPGAESGNGNKYLQARLLKAVDNIDIPVLIVHPSKDASLAPGYALGQEFQRLGKPYGLFIYPPYGIEAQQGHCFGGSQGIVVWAVAALQFLSQYLK